MFYGKNHAVACDGKCKKAWRHQQPAEDFSLKARAFLNDGDLIPIMQAVDVKCPFCGGHDTARIPNNFPSSNIPRIKEIFDKARKLTYYRCNDCGDAFLPGEGGLQNLCSASISPC